MLRSIRWRLTLSYVILTILTIGTVGFLSLYYLDSYAERQEREYLRVVAQNIAAQARPLLAARKAAAPLLQQLVDTAGFLGNVSVRVRDSHDKLLVESSGVGQRTLLFRPSAVYVEIPPNPERQVYSAQQSGGEHRRLAAESPAAEGPAAESPAAENPIAVIRKHQGLVRPQFFFSIPESRSEHNTSGREIPVDHPKSSQTLTVPIGEGTPLAFLEVSAGPDFSSQLVRPARNAFLLATLGAILVAALVGLFMGKKLSSPLLQLSAAARAMGEQDWAVRAPDCGKDEIGQLARQFNLMADRLESSFRTISRERDALRRFIADASHELRTPITALATFFELMQTGAAHSEKTRRDFLGESQRQIEKLGWIVHNLLDLSRLDAGITSLSRRECSCLALVRAAISSVNEKAEAKQVRLVHDAIEPTLTAVCDQERMEMAIRNLLDNAIVFSLPGHSVEIRAWQTEEHCLISVKDSGSGIAAEDLPHIFERFYRSPQSRHGTGLGLAIVRSIIETHEGTVSVESKIGEGSLFTVRFPRQNPPSRSPEGSSG